MKVRIQENEATFMLTIEPENVEESAMLMRLATIGKKEISTIKLYPSADGAIFYRLWFDTMRGACAIPGIER